MRENETNPAPVWAEFRLDGGFGTCDNVALLIEMGYEVYTKAHNNQVVAFLQGKTAARTRWTRVGANNVRKAGIKRQVKVGAHVSAQVTRGSEGWLLRFNETSAFAGQVLKVSDNLHAPPG
jgi:hypothetical protein